MNSNLRTGDNVVVIAGKDKGKTGKIMSSDSRKGKVVVEGVNIVHKHTKPRSQKDKGGIKKVEAGIDVSNVMILCPACGKATRIGHAFDEQGNKHRACKKCGAFMDGEKKTRTKKEAKSVSEKKTKVEKTEEKEKVKTAPKKTVAKSTKSTGVESSKIAGTTKRKAPVAKSQGK